MQVFDYLLNVINWRRRIYAITPPTPPETPEDLAYWREYLLDPLTIRVPSIVNVAVSFDGDEDADDLDYFRSYLGES